MLNPLGVSHHLLCTLSTLWPTTVPSHSTCAAGHQYVGVDFCRGICGVSVIRSGEAMENALRECCQGIKLGKILVHRHGSALEEVVYERLPHDIAERYVLLLDPVLGTGHTACRAIQVQYTGL